MKTFEDYQVSLLRFSRDYLARLETQQVREKLVEAMHNLLWDLDGPRYIERDLTSRDIFFSMVFGGFNEITTSYLCLRDIEIYVRRFPYGDTSISRSRHLEYHIANYLQEVYILKNRLKAYLKRIRRAHRKSQGRAEIEEALDLVDSMVDRTFVSIAKVRGAHVHERRYSDDNLDRIQTWELLASYQDDEKDDTKLYEFLNDYSYREVRREWTKRIKSNNDNIKSLLDSYFGVLYSVVFQEGGDLRFPN
jgi:hypothetical protein